MEALFGEQLQVKTTFKSDIRRFRCSKSTSFDQLCSQIADLYKITSFIIKYVDDEEDMISVTSSAELEEAFRLASSLTSSQTALLRLSIFATKDAPPIYEYTNWTEENTTNINININTTNNDDNNDDEKEYPKLDPADWDAPVKITDKSEMTTEKEEAEDDEDSKEYPCLPVDDWAPSPKQKYNNNNMPQATEQIEIFYPSKSSSSSSSSSSSLSSSPLTRQCSQLCTDTSLDCLSQSETIVKDCRDLSNEIRDSCIDFSQKTVADTLKYVKELKSELITIPNGDCEYIRNQIMQECFSLANDTSKMIGKISDDISDGYDGCFESGEEGGSLLDGWQRLSSATSANTQQLCSETSKLTSQMCCEISKGLNAVSKVPQTIASSFDDSEWKANCDKLRSDTKQDCFDYSSSTISSCVTASDDIVKLIMGL